MDRLKNRADFLRAARGIRRVEGSVTLEVCLTPEKTTSEKKCAPERLRLGFTTSRKIGNAVIRNRARRRLRAAAHQLLPELGRAGHDYVLVARRAAPSCPFPVLLEDITRALKGAHRKLDGVKKEAAQHV